MQQPDTMGVVAPGNFDTGDLVSLENKPHRGYNLAGVLTSLVQLAAPATNCVSTRLPRRSRSPQRLVLV